VAPLEPYNFRPFIKGISMNLRNLLCVLGLGLGVAGGVSCGAAEELFDCQSVCSRYQTCFDKNYDVGACRSRCKENSDKDQDFKRKADSCQACIDDRSCSSATFNCATSCVGVVP
jgi:hypothetical protein